jgi:hypothetical protein
MQLNTKRKKKTKTIADSKGAGQKGKSKEDTREANIKTEKK